MKKYNHSFMVARFQPLHNGHKMIIDKMLKESKYVTIILGSCQESGTSSNPLSPEQRLNLIENIYNKKKKIKKNFKKMGIIATTKTLCCNPSYIKQETKLNIPDYNNIIDEQQKNQNITLIQSYFRGYQIRKLYKMTPIEKKNLCQEIPFSYSTQKYDSNEKILKLRSLLPKF